MGTALKTFEIAYTRADRIFAMACTLTDDRTRALRSDRADNIKRMMHWPLRHKIDRAESRDMLIIIKDGSALTRRDFCHEL